MWSKALTPSKSTKTPKGLIPVTLPSKLTYFQLAEAGERVAKRLESTSLLLLRSVPKAGSQGLAFQRFKSTLNKCDRGINPANPAHPP